jgi:SpoVK/Ycf46/Vps4 family AAA+-type ATPase
VNINDIEPIQFEAGIMKPVLDKDQEEILRTAMKLIRSKENNFGKGYDSEEATIILLHGGPGLGKTLTTRYVAERLERPLISFSAGDLGSNPEAVNMNLDWLLKYAERWNAVLVIENADVLLEQRIKGDINHNSVVMAFLRALEKYSGVIILTTTRVGALDESIEARVQLAIEYGDLTREGREKIWRDIIEDVSRTHLVDKRDLLDHLPDIINKPMNVREILSAFKIGMQTVKEGRALKWVHLAKFFKPAENFNKYINDIRKITRDQRAFKMGDRPLPKNDTGLQHSDGEGEGSKKREGDISKEEDGDALREEENEHKR